MESIYEDYLQMAAKTPLFAGFGRKGADDAIKAMEGELQIFRKGMTISEQKEAALSGSMMLILSGMVHLVRFGVHGECHLIDYSFAGSVTGYIGPLSTGHLFSGFYVAGRDSIILKMTVPDLAILEPESRRKLESNLLKIVFEKYTRLLRKGDIMTRRYVRDKILAYLMYESRLRQTRSFDIPLSRQELADYMSVDRTTLSTELTRLQRSGVLLKHGRHFELLQDITPPD